MLIWLQNRPGSSPALQAKQKKRCCKTEAPGRARDFRILVVDKIGQGWLGAWDRNFKELHITRKHSSAVETRKLIKLCRPALSNVLPPLPRRP